MFDFDMRKWTERKIAFFGFCSGVTSLLLTTILGIYFSWTSKTLNEKTYCFNAIGPKLEAVKGYAYDLPKLVSGCAVAPASYCGDARSSVTKTKLLLLDITSSSDKKIEIFNHFLKSLNQAGSDLTDTNGSNQDVLIEDAANLTLLRQPIMSIGVKDISCKSSLF